MRRKRVTAVVIAVVALLFALAAFRVFWPWGWYSSRTRARSLHVEIWNQLTEHSVPWPAVDSQLLREVEVRHEPTVSYVSYPWSGWSHPLYAGYRIYRMGPGAAARGPSLKLHYVGVASIDGFTPEELADNPLQKVVPLRLYTPDGKLISDERARTILSEKERQVKTYPFGRLVHFYFDVAGLDSPRVIGHRLFDRHNRQASRNIRTLQDSRPFRVGFQLGFWNAGPADLMIDVAHGPVQTRQLRAAVGEAATFEKLACRIVAIVDGKVRWGSSSDDQGRRTTQYHVERDENTPQTTVIFSFSPPYLQWLTFAALTRDEQEVACTARGQWNVMGVTFDRPKEDLRTLKVTFRPNTARFIVSVEKIPTVPSASEAVKNLFDVRIPYAVAPCFCELQNYVCNSVNMHLSCMWMSPNIPPGFFPREYVNATPRDMLRDLADLYGLEPKVDSRNCVIRFGPSPSRRLDPSPTRRHLRDIGRFFRNIWN